MSVSMFLVPQALALRQKKGEQYFYEWLEARGVYLTAFANKRELIETVRKAGYETRRYLGSLVTYIDEDRFFYWEYVNRRWVAEIGRRTFPKEKIRKFIEDVNAAAGQHVIGTPTETEETVREPETRTKPTTESGSDTYFYPSNFRDGELLFRTLEAYGANPVRRGDEIECRVEEAVMIFRRTEEGSPYQAEIRNAADTRKIGEHLANLDDDYKRALQAAVYEKLMARVAEKRMRVESEEVLDDNSIVLTINVNG